MALLLERLEAASYVTHILLLTAHNLSSRHKAIEQFLALSVGQSLHNERGDLRHVHLLPLLWIRTLLFHSHPLSLRPLL